MNNHFAFLPMRPSDDLLDRPADLVQRLEQDGYLYLRGVLDPERIHRLRMAILAVLARHGWVAEADRPGQAYCTTTPVREGDEEFFAVYDDVQRIEELHTLAHDPALLEVMRAVVGPTAFPHPLKIARLSFPDHYEVSTPPHQDHPNNQGTQALTAAWIPLGPIPFELGGLAVLRGSHRWGPLPLQAHIGAGNRAAVLPMDLQEECRWVTTEYSPGDVVVFGSTTVHASLHNASEFHMRLSVDYRFQPEGEALTPACLEPHFGRLTWDEVYEGWSSTEHQHYWRDLDYEVVPWQDLEIVDRKDAMDRDDVAQIMRYRARRDARVQRRLAALAEAVDPSGAAPTAPERSRRRRLLRGGRR